MRARLRIHAIVLVRDRVLVCRLAEGLFGHDAVLRGHARVACGEGVLLRGFVEADERRVRVEGLEELRG